MNKFYKTLKWAILTLIIFIVLYSLIMYVESLISIKDKNASVLYSKNIRKIDVAISWIGDDKQQTLSGMPSIIDLNGKSKYIDCKTHLSLKASHAFSIHVNKDSISLDSLSPLDFFNKAIRNEISSMLACINSKLNTNSP